MKDTMGITKTSLLRFHELYSRVKEKKKKLKEMGWRDYVLPY